MQTYRMEIPAVKHSTDKLRERLDRFAERYRRIVEAGQGVCLTDNAMGNLAFQGHELIRELGLPAPTGRVMVHLNTFHPLGELREIADSCAKLGVGELLIVSGDGSARLPKLKPAELETDVPGVTSVELLTFLRKHYGNIFRYGAVYNQYEPPEHEKEKLRRNGLREETILSGAVYEPRRLFGLPPVRIAVGEPADWILIRGNRFDAEDFEFISADPGMRKKTEGRA